MSNQIALSPNQNEENPMRGGGSNQIFDVFSQLHDKPVPMGRTSEATLHNNILSLS
jgi:hypothetical protein